LTSMKAIFDTYDPIAGDVAQFAAAAIEHKRLGDMADQVEQSFTLFERDATTSFEGDSAEAFLAVVEGLRKRLRLVPDVAYAVQRIMENHCKELETLREQARKARAAAKTNWRQREQCADALRFACTQPDNQAQVDQLERDLQTADGYLSRSLDCWYDFSTDEDQLDRRTAEALNHVPLGDLEDGFFDGWLGKLTAFVLLGPLGGVVFLELLEAYQDNGWAGLLWKLNDGLGYALLALAVVSLVVPGLSPWLAAVIFGLAALKLGTSITIKAKGYRNPETGEEMSGCAIGMDVVTVVFAGASVVKALRASSAVGKAKNATSYVDDARTGFNKATGTAKNASSAANDPVGAALAKNAALAADDAKIVLDDAVAAADEALLAADDLGANAGFLDKLNEPETFWNFGPSTPIWDDMHDHVIDDPSLQRRAIGSAAP